MNFGDVAAFVAQYGAGAATIYLGQVLLQWRKQESSSGLEIKKHRDRLTIEMLEMARAEVTAARAEVQDLRKELETRERDLDRLRGVEWRLSAFDEAIQHVEALLTSDARGGREAAENAARVFLARMEAMKLKMGGDANAAQVRLARTKLQQKDLNP
jgi:hypothetical protein